MGNHVGVKYTESYFTLPDGTIIKAWLTFEGTKSVIKACIADTNQELQPLSSDHFSKPSASQTEGH